MNLPFTFLRLAVENAFQKGQTARVPEPDLVTTAAESVRQYKQALQTKLTVLYDLACNWIYMSRQDAGGQAVDLGCGPGFFTQGLAKPPLTYRSVVGVDLSPEMIDAARTEAQDTDGNGHLSFEQGDMTNLQQFETDAFNLVCCMGILHHLPDLEFVSRALLEAERIAKPTGLIFVLEYVRFKSTSVIDKYAEASGSELLEDDLPDLYTDYRNSLYAAWTIEELCSTVPRKSQHRWFHVAPWFLPPFQFLMGIPRDQKRLILRKPPPIDQALFSGRIKYPADWALSSFLMKTARKWEIS